MFQSGMQDLFLHQRMYFKRFFGRCTKKSLKYVTTLHNKLLFFSPYTGPGTCRVIYDYYLEAEKIDKLNKSEEYEDYMDKSLLASDQVHQEDAMICESVQRGLGSSGYDIGRYAPGVEMADHQFHLALGKQYRELLEKQGL